MCYDHSVKAAPGTWNVLTAAHEVDGSGQGGCPQWSCWLAAACWLGDVGMRETSHNRQSVPEMWQLEFYRGLITGSEEQPLLKQLLF